MEQKKLKGSLARLGILNVLQGGQGIVIFQKNGVVKSYDNKLPIKRPNQYKK